MNRIEIGDSVSFIGRVVLRAGENATLRIGSNVALNNNVLIDASGGEVSIGSDCLLGPNVVIRASNHVFSRSDVPIRAQGHMPGIIVIEDDVWIAANVVILPNVTIGKGCVIAAGAVVTRSIPAGAIAGGVPAKVLRFRDTASERS